MIKDLRMDYSRNITRKRYYSAAGLVPALFSAFDAGLPCREAVFVIEELEHPVSVTKPEGEVLIYDRGFAWYELALPETHFWLSADFTPAGELIELYFDITGGNDFSDPENPRFEDMYLDVVLNPAGRMVRLDEDELEAAVRNGAVSPGQAGKALCRCRGLEAFLQAHRRALPEFCRERMRQLRPLLPPR